MKKENIKKAYDHVSMNEDMDQEILANLISDKPKKTLRYNRKLVMAGVAAVLLIALFNVPSFKAFALDVINNIRYSVLFGNERVEMNAEEKNIRGQLPQTEMKYNTFEEVEEAIGVHLLSSDMEYTDAEGMIFYTSVRNDDGRIYGIMLQDHFYSLGDLENIQVITYEDTYDDRNALNEVVYTPGSVYQSPVSVQIAVVVDSEQTQEHGILGFTGMSATDISKADGYVSAQEYHIDAIDEDAVVLIVEGYGIGPAVWQGNDDDSLKQMSMAMFTHDGVEYLYMSLTSYEGMTAFLDTLHE